MTKEEAIQVLDEAWETMMGDQKVGDLPKRLGEQLEEAARVLREDDDAGRPDG